MSSKPERELYESSTKPSLWRPLSFALSLFHAVVRERRKYGALGWNCRYDFNDSDLRVSMRQLHLMVETFDEPPLKALRYLAGECNYGGRVTDDQDRKTLTALLADFYSQKTVEQSANSRGYDFTDGCGATDDSSALNIVCLPDLESYLEHIQAMPDTESPMVVGLHPSADINQALLEADDILSLVLQASSGTAQSGEGQNTAESQLVVLKAMQSRVRGKPFDSVAIRRKFAFTYENSMNVVLVQEVSRYNRLLVALHASLKVLTMTLEGAVVSTQSTEAALQSILGNRVPAAWSKISFPSMKPLSSWLEDLSRRTALLDEWIARGRLPDLFWLSGLYFPQSFLTACKQDYARKYTYPIDHVSLEAEVGVPGEG